MKIFKNRKCLHLLRALPGQPVSIVEKFQSLALRQVHPLEWFDR